MTAERPEPRTKVSSGTAEGTSCARQTLPACNETTEHSVTVTMEEVLSRSNLLQAYHRVVGNKGAAGVDGMTVDELWAYCQQHWERHREELLGGTYRPSPVRKVEIPKPGGKPDLPVATLQVCDCVCLSRRTWPAPATVATRHSPLSFDPSVNPRGFFCELIVKESELAGC